ncbi:MAG: hypothetical protein ACTSUQ_01580 [Candidatus Freyarchaeota archaeon]
MGAQAFGVLGEVHPGAPRASGGPGGHPEPAQLPAHPNPGLVEDDVACALQRPLEVAPRGAVGAVHPPANRPGGCARSPTRPGRCSLTSRRLSLNPRYKLVEYMIISGGVLQRSKFIHIMPRTGELLQNKP